MVEVMESIISIEVAVIETVESTKPIISIEVAVAKAPHAHSRSTTQAHSKATRHGHSRATTQAHSKATRHGHSRATRHPHTGATSEGMSAAKATTVAATVAGSCDYWRSECCRKKATQENYNF
jgi:hypothetical protein